LRIYNITMANAVNSNMGSAAPQWLFIPAMRGK